MQPKERHGAPEWNVSKGEVRDGQKAERFLEKGLPEAG